MNISNKEFKIKDNDKKTIEMELKNLSDWIEEKPYQDRDTKELKKIVHKIRKKYGTLILKNNDDNGNVKDNDDGNAGKQHTTVYGDEEDEETVFEQLEKEEFGLSNDMTDEEKEELKQLRINLVNLCYTVIDIINCNTVNMETSHRDELRDYIDDILLWSHVREKIKKSEYVQKINQLNDSCNKIMEKYSNDDIFNKDEISTRINNTRSELEQMCFALQSCIISNYFPLDEDHTKTLLLFVNDTLEWILKQDIEKKRCELEGSIYQETEDKYKDRLNKLNELCDVMYQKINNINIGKPSIFADENAIVLEDIVEDSTLVDNTEMMNLEFGTTVSQLKESMSQEESSKLSNEPKKNVRKGILEQTREELEKEAQDKKNKEPGGTLIEKLREMSQIDISF